MSTRERLIGAARWVAIVPAWLLTVVVIGLAFQLLAASAAGSGEEVITGPWFTQNIRHPWILVVRGVVVGSVAMYAAIYVTPRYKREVAFVLAGVLTAPVTVLDALVLWFVVSGRMGLGDAVVDLAMYTPLVVASFLIAAKVEPDGSLRSY